MIESYLDALTGKKGDESEITPLVKSLRGPEEELFDVVMDPYQLKNLAAGPE